MKLKKGQIVRIKGEHKLDNWGSYISGGNYTVGKYVKDGFDGQPSIELFNKSRQRFTKAGSRNLVPLTVLDKALGRGTMVVKENTSIKLRDLLNDGVLKEGKSEWISIWTYDDVNRNNWSDYNSVIKEYPILKKLPKDFVQKIFNDDYLSTKRRHQLNGIEKAIVKQFKKVGIEAVAQEGGDTVIEIEVSL